MDGFCGEPLWNPIDASEWNRTTSIEFTECFKQTVLTYVPCAFLWLSLIYEYYSLKNSSSRRIPWNFLNAGKLLLSILLFVSSAVELSFTIYDGFTQHNVYPVQYIAPFVRACSYRLTLSLLLQHRKKGIHTSGSLFLFWMLLSVYAVLNYQQIFVDYWPITSYPDNFDTHVESVRSYVFKTIEFPLILSQFFLAFFADVRSQYIAPGQEFTKVCPEEFASFPSQIIFQWVTPLIRLGYKRPLKIADMWDLKSSHTTDHLLSQFNQFWKKRTKNEGEVKSNRNVGWMIIRFLWPLFAYCFVMKLVQTVLMLSSPIVLDWLITFMSSDDPNWKGYFYAFLLFTISLSESMIEGQYLFGIGLLQMKVKTCFMSIVYKKALVLSNDGRKDFSTGQIINLMGVDVQVLTDYVNLFNVIWAAPVQLLVCFVLLWQQLGVATLAGAATLILLVPINSYCTSMMKKYQVILMKQLDKRSKLVDEILNGIKIIKLYAWEESFKKKITGIRNEEVRCMNKSAYFMVANAFAFTCANFVVSLVLFVTYLMIDKNNVLTANNTMVTLSLLNSLRIPFGQLPMAIMMSAVAQVSLKRITKYLNADELEEDSQNDLAGSYNSEEVTEEKPKTSNSRGRNAVTIKNGSFAWNKDGEACLKHINLRVERNSLIAVVGKVGSGKSSLANALIGELRKNSGSIQVNGSISYVPQLSWILNSTLRDNVVFMNPFDQELYDKVLKICALSDDLKMLPNGDLTEIGEKGINLSGGQKQRVSLARACYSNSDIYVLDDPLSAVDSHVGKHIFDKVIGPRGYLRNKTRILITHKIPLLNDVDRIIVLQDGQISEQGSYNELIDAKGEFAEILNTYIKEEKERAKEENLEQSIEESLRKSLRRYSLVEQADNDKGRLTAEEKQEVGSVKWSVYKDFLTSMSSWLIFFILLAFTLSSAFNIATSLWLTAWSDDARDPMKNNDTSLRNKRIGFYAGYGLSEAIFTLLSFIFLNIGLIEASKQLHSGMLSKVLRAPMLFFDTTPIGRVLNRFTKDLNTADFSLRYDFRIVISQFFQTIVSIVILCIETPIFLVVSVPIGFLYVYIQKLYIATCRQLRRLESTTRSPIYSHFSETVHGASSVRAYGIAEKFIDECHRRIDLNNSCFYPSTVVNRWLMVRLGFLGFIVVLLSGVFAVLYRDTLSPSMAGLAISFSLSFTQLLTYLIRSYSDVETSIVSVERCFEYTKLETEAAAKSEFPPDPEWPSKGVVKFKNYGTRYRKDLDPVLKNLTFETRENEKIGICGRTGAGKSSLTLAMFRLLEPSEGTIEIDGVDIRTLGLEDLRSNLTIIPQDPFLYSDTLRMNLDPFSKYADDELWKALELANLKEFVQESPEGLDKMVEEGGSNLSVGQRQLVCLARALLRRTKVLILDEATAACDFETDEVIQKTIRSAFANNTILTIAHRLNTIIDYDKVIVLEKGELREFDSPKRLLEDKNSIFYSMAKESGLV